MCGIFGQYATNGVEAGLMERMALALAHRGPDGCGTYDNSVIAFGATRLAIIDVKSGAQPVFNEDRQIVVVFNGEIYNHRTLRTELESQGHQFTTRTDTEVLVHGYESWGMGLLDRLRGMFAFAIWDESRGQLLLARDRAGEKPLYYFQSETGLVFASEVKALFEAPNVPRTVNGDVLSDYLILGYVPPPATLFKAIYKLAPGEFLVAEHGQFRTGRYWRPVMDTTANDLTYSEAVKQTRRLLAESVDTRLMSDVPVGALLSGGLDSAAVVALASQQSAQPISTFTVAFDFENDSHGHKKFNVDSYYAGLIAARFKTDHHVLTVRQTPQMAELLPHLIYALDEPVAQPSIMLSACIAALARKSGISVLLTGDGGDELFAGYPSYRADRILDRYLQVPFQVRKPILNPILSRIPSVSGRRLVQKSHSTEPVDRYLNWQRMIDPAALSDLLVDNDLVVRSNARLEAILNPLLAAPKTRHFADRIAFAGLSLWLAEDSNMRVDKMNMAMSVEARAPFEDHQLVGFAFGLPLDYKLRNRDFKRVMKDAVHDILPTEILERPKWGFVPPSSDWLRTIFQSLVATYLSPERVEAAGWFNPATVTQLFESHRTHQSYELWSLWPLLVFQIWHALYIDQSLKLDHHLMPDEVLHLATGM